MEYRGGTYISQVEARSADQVLQPWARNLDSGPIAGFEEQDKRELIAAFEDHDDARLVPLDGLTNSWCTSTLISGNLVLVNVVATISTP
jgi:hypothetical protein